MIEMRIFSSPPSFIGRIKTLENHDAKTITEFWDSIPSGTTSGTLSPRAGHEFVANQWEDGVDAIVTGITGGVPNLDPVYTAAGVLVTATLNTTSGAYTLSGEPAGTDPVALVTAQISAGSGTAIVQNLGTKDTNYTVDFNLGLVATVTTGTGAATLTIPNWTGAYLPLTPARLYITQGATARTQTFGAASGTNNNIISSGGLMSAGDALPNSGASAVDMYEMDWRGDKWVVTNALYDIKA